MAVLRTYQHAIDILQSRSGLWRSANDSTYKRSNIPNNYYMKGWLKDIGHEDLNDLNVIHITGTKGKGSTAAYTESLIRAYFRRRGVPITVGLYTSPHIIEERDRIRVNSAPVSKELFASSFFEVWDCVNKATTSRPLPAYLQLIALVSVHIFKKTAVDVAIYEVHAGGRKDATNIFDHPVACGFTTIGLDHIDLLGGSVQSIAQHKSGIMKHKKPAYSTPQGAVVTEVLETESAKLNCQLEFTGIDPNLPDLPQLLLDVQKHNASLAIKLANGYLRTQSKELAADDIRRGIQDCKLPGRFQAIHDDKGHWFLDIAHNCLSLPVALAWFKAEIMAYPRAKNVLIFGHESQRDTFSLISTIVEFCGKHDLQVDEIILPPYTRCGVQMNASADSYVDFWRSLQPSSEIKCSSSLKDTMTDIGKRHERHLTLITGSTYLVGEALRVLQSAGKLSVDEA